MNNLPDELILSVKYDSSLFLKQEIIEAIESKLEEVGKDLPQRMTVTEVGSD